MSYSQNFGWAVEPAEKLVIVANHMVGSPFTSAISGPASSMTVWLEVLPTTRGRCVLFDRITLAWIATTAERSNLTNGWNVFTFPIPPTIVAGTRYVLCYYAGAGYCQYGFTAVGGIEEGNTVGLTYPVVPDPVVFSYYLARRMSIYCTVGATQEEVIVNAPSIETQKSNSMVLGMTRVRTIRHSAGLVPVVTGE